MTHPLRLAGATLVAVAALSSSAPAGAVTYNSTSAGTACQAANSAATKFQWTNHYVRNLNPSQQFIVCNLPVSDATLPVPSPSLIVVDVQSGGFGSTVTCIAQTGYFMEGAVVIHSSATRSYEFVTDTGTTQLVWDAGALTRTSSYDTVTLNCKMDYGIKLGLIQFEM